MTAALSDDELARIKRECLDNVLGFGAVPYIGVTAVYTIIQANVVPSTAALPTTSATAVTSTGAAVLTLASVTGYLAAQRVVIDSDDQRESCTVRAVSGSTISVVCRKLHAGTYPVEVESPLTIVRGILSDLISVEQAEQTMLLTAGVKKADEVEFFGRLDGGPFQALEARRDRLRDELARACGISYIVNAGRARMSGGGSIEVY